MPAHSSSRRARHGRVLLTLWALLSVLCGAAVAAGAAGPAQTGPSKLWLPLLADGQAAPQTGRWVSAYYVGYQRDLYPVEEVDFSGMTHLIVGRIRPAPNGDVITNFDIDEVSGPQMARRLAQRAHEHQRKALLMLGGAGEHDGFVGAASAQNRALFVQNLLQVMDQFGYDGIDVDWEPITEEDRPNLLALLRDLRAARPGMIITIPVGWVNANFPEEVDGYYAEVAEIVDQMNIMSYDMAGDWGGWDSWHSSALYGHAPTHPTSIEASVEAYLEAGVPPARLGIGVGFYGSCWRGVTAPRVPLAGRNVSQGNSDNAMSYTNIMRDYYPQAQRSFDTEAQVPYLSSTAGAGPQRCNFISYEDEESIAAKGAYVRKGGLGGAIVWTIGQGHLPDAPAGSRDPLMQALRSALLTP